MKYKPSQIEDPTFGLSIALFINKQLTVYKENVGPKGVKDFGKPCGDKSGVDPRN